MTAEPRAAEVLAIPSEEAMQHLLDALNVSRLNPELACSGRGGAFLATLTDPDADHVHIVRTDESGREHCCECSHDGGTCNSFAPGLWPAYPVLALVTEWPDMDRVAAEDFIDPWWLAAGCLRDDREAIEAELSDVHADYDRRGERLWRLAAMAGHVPHQSDNDATAELAIATRLAARDDREGETVTARLNRLQVWAVPPGYAGGLLDQMRGSVAVGMVRQDDLLAAIRPPVTPDGCRWSSARQRWEIELRPGVSKEPCDHATHPVTPDGGDQT